MTKSSLAKEKGVQVEDFVANRQRQARDRVCNRKFPQLGASIFFTDDPETLCCDRFVLDRR
jgi:hypothetical protein